MSSVARQSIKMLAAAVALTAPWVAMWGTHSVHGFSTGVVVLISGLSVLGASFLLAWAAETAEKDVPRAFAIAVLAVLAVAPEYAVDALYAWNAGAGGATAEACGQLSAATIEAAETPLAGACKDANLAIANMTGANRILIGLGWSGIALFTVLRAGAAMDTAVEKRSGLLGDAVTLDPDISLEVVFLLLATLWAFLVPFNGGLDIFDLVFLVGLYVAYIVIVLRGDVEPPEEHVGVPHYLQSFARRYRVAAVVLLFAYSGAMIFTAVEPFAHGLEDLGTNIGVPSFFMIQWIAPLASESPELIVVAYLVNKARSTAGFNALISSKLNQWTLLIGTLVVVYSIALGRYGVLTFDAKQAAEIWLTAGQSFFAIAILVNLEISIREALVLLVLFTSQVLLEFLIIRGVTFPLTAYELLLVYTGIYLVLGLALFATRWGAFRELVGRSMGTISDAFQGSETAHGAD